MTTEESVLEERARRRTKWGAPQGLWARVVRWFFNPPLKQ